GALRGDLGRGEIARGGGASAAPERWPQQLLRGSWEYRQFAEIAWVVLDDDSGVEILRDLFETVERRERRGAIGVEGGHAVTVVILMEVGEIAAEEHVALLFQPDQQGVMAGRMPGRVQHDDGAVAEHVLVERCGLDLAAAADPVCKIRGVHPGSRLCGCECVPIALADQERRFRK